MDTPTLLEKALRRRQALVSTGVQAFRAFSGAPDGLDGIYIDVYGEGAVLIVYESQSTRGIDTTTFAAAVLGVLRPLGVRAVYLKPFAKDRSKLGGELPSGVTDPIPAAGEVLPESVLIKEHGWKLEVRLYDGLSTGLFLDQRDNRAWVSRWCVQRAKSAGAAPSVLNTFAYTCAFSVAAATGGASTTSVDVSARYIEWGKRNFAHNGLDTAAHRFARMGTFEFFSYARRKGLTYDLIILDPPSFAAGSKKKGVQTWSSVADYARLVSAAAGLLTRGGVILASTNTQELTRPGRLEREVVKGLGRAPKWLPLPETPLDFAIERERFAALALAPRSG